MKAQENQKLNYKSLIFMLSLAGLLCSIGIPSLSRQRDEGRLINAKRQAEVLGYQVFEIYREASHTASISTEIVNSRSPASMRTNGGDTMNFRDAGSIGNDPWGQPYRYKILSASGEQLKVQIWSAGPNKAFETKDEPGSAADSYVGDDVGIVLALNNRPQE
jgi:type II secretory pathway pseudopilin PulG